MMVENVTVQEEGLGQGLDQLVSDMRQMLSTGSTVEQVRAEYTDRLVVALQDDRDRALYVVGLLVEAALREALRHPGR